MSTNAFFEHCKQDISANFEAFNQHPGEIGNCKKMLPLKLLNTNYDGLAVVFSHGTQDIHQKQIEKEFACLSYLKNQGYAVVPVIGSPFVVQSKHEQERYGMLMPYIEGVFIEAKTPTPLNLLILSGLLGIGVSPKENWIAQNLQALEQSIRTKLQNCNMELLREKAIKLGGEFKRILDKVNNSDEMIVDLQMIITQSGELTIIDPMDVVDLKNYQSYVEISPTIPSKELPRFLTQTKNWLAQANLFCQIIAKATYAQELLPFVSLHSGPLVFSQTDPKQKSRLAQLKSGKTSPRSSPLQAPFKFKY
ncbi:MAG: hypothetical protein AB7V32_08600 [Candidatus Berkiella sp.]